MSQTTGPEPQASGLEAFVAHRDLLFTVAYEMLGSAADAEDVLQETWMRWAGVDQTVVENPRAYLVRITTRQALTRLRTLGRRKELYVGPWLPEPLRTTPDVADDVELADSVSTAMLLVLETLSPIERAVFVLREVFDVDYDEIGQTISKTPAAVRQIAHRARTHVAARRPRVQVSASETRAALDAFRRAVQTGDIQPLVEVLAPDAVLFGDGGGVVQAALAPVRGLDAVASLLSRISSGIQSVEETEVNGRPALIMKSEDGFDAVVTVEVVDGRIVALYAVRNPEKLSRLSDVTPLRR